MTIAEYDQHPVQFDAAISISSFEHDGLGRFVSRVLLQELNFFPPSHITYYYYYYYFRYGDPIRPDGDITMMGKMKCIVREGGLLFLSVPIAKSESFSTLHECIAYIFVFLAGTK